MKISKVMTFLLLIGMLYSCGIIEIADKVGVDEIDLMFEGMDEGETAVIDAEDLDEELLDLYAQALTAMGEDGFEIGEIELINSEVPAEATSSKAGAYIIEHRRAYGRHCSHSSASSCSRSGSKGKCSKLGYGWVRISRKFSWGPPVKQVDIYLCKNYKGRRNCCTCKVKVTSIYIDPDDDNFYTRDVEFTR